MPVNRAKIRVQNTAAGGVVRPGEGPAGEDLRRDAGAVARRAAQYAQGLAATNIEEARLLAREAVLNVGPDGRLNIPPNAAARMGTLAQRSYDHTLEASLDQRLSTEINRLASDSRNRNLHNSEAFAQDFGQVFDTFLGQLPQELRGVATAIGAGAAASEGSTVGHNEATLRIRARADEVPVFVENAAAKINEAILGGRDEDAEALIENAIVHLELQPHEVLLPGDRARHIQSLRLQQGEARLLRDFNVRDMSYGELSALHAGLVSGEISANGLFLNPEGTAPDPDAGRKAAALVQQFMGEANRKAGESLDAANETARHRLLIAGQAPDTQEYRESFDNLLGLELGKIDPRFRSSTGGARGLVPSDWEVIAADPSLLTRALTGVNQGSMLTESLTQYLRGIDNLEDPAALTQAFDVLRALDLGVNREGGTAQNLIDQLSPRMQEIYAAAEIASAANGHYGFAGQREISSAIQTIIAHSDEPWDDPRRVEAWGSGDPSTIQGLMDEVLIDEIFDGATPYDEEMARARQALDFGLQHARNREDAIAHVERSMQDRWQETNFMPSGRSMHAPEKHYPEPPAGSLWEGLSRLGDDVLGTAVDAAEFSLEYGPIQALFGIEIDLPGHARGEPYFEVLANQKIQEFIQNEMPEDFLQETFEAAGNGTIDLHEGAWLEPGNEGHYRLVQTDQGGHGQPVYHVEMRGPGGIWEVLADEEKQPFVLDVRNEYARLDEVQRVLGMLEQQVGVPAGEINSWLADPYNRGVFLDHLPQINALLDSDDPNRDGALLTQLRIMAGMEEPTAAELEAIRQNRSPRPVAPAPGQAPAPVEITTHGAM